MTGTLYDLPLGRGRIRARGSPAAIAGILNVTPDSFSDGGVLRTVDDCIAAADRMLREGATLLDVGGESSRPGAGPVPVAVEIARVVPVVRELARRFAAPISVDTVKADVFRAAYDAGASMLNDVSALSADPGMAAALASTDAAAILMHRRGSAANMMELCRYGDVVSEVAAELAEAVTRARAAGVPDARIVLDPGIGFAKSADQNWQLLKDPNPLRLSRFPLMVGPSRKAFLGALTGRANPADRDVATAVVVAALAGRGIEILRVHDVAAARDAIAVAARLEQAP